MCIRDRHWDGFPLGLGLVVEDKPTELSCTHYTQHTHRKLTLQSLKWSYFEKDEELEADCTAFVQVVQEQLNAIVSISYFNVAAAIHN